MIPQISAMISSALIVRKYKQNYGITAARVHTDMRSGPELLDLPYYGAVLRKVLLFLGDLPCFCLVLRKVKGERGERLLFYAGEGAYGDAERAGMFGKRFAEGCP